MNELEINKAVAEKLGYEYVVHGGELYILVPHPELPGEERQRFRDYCGEWKDAGPIIEKYKISINFDYAAKIWYADTVSEGLEHVRFEDVSALKAAMLCFLEMEI